MIDSKVYEKLANLKEELIKEERCKMINSTRIHEILCGCFYTEEDIQDFSKPPKDAILVEGIVNNFGLNPKKVELYRNEINSILDQLNPDIKQGISFLNLVVDKDGNHWGEQINAEQLVVLGIAIGRLQYSFPRSIWMMLPGGVPYIVDNK